MKTIQVYVACLSVGQSKASDIAKKAKLTRSSVYRCLEVLEERGLVHQEIREGLQYYQASDPQAIPQLVERQSLELQSILPMLLQLFATSSGNKMPRFRFYGEAGGMRTVFEEILHTPSKRYDVFGSIHDTDLIYSVSEDYMNTWTKRRIQEGIFHRSLRTQISKEDPIRKANPLLAQSGPTVFRDIRFAPASIALPVLIYLFDDKVAFVNAKLGRQFAAVLESKDMYEALKSLFDFVWELSEPAGETK